MTQGAGRSAEIREGPRTRPAAAAALMKAASSSGFEGIVNGTFMHERTAGSTGDA